MSKKLWHPTSGALLAGCLVATTAHAQDAPITPITEPATAVAPVPERVAAPNKPISTLGLDLQFRDIPVKQLLSTLGEQFNINIAVNADVDGVIGSINLVNQTPEEALQTAIAVAGNLTLNRMPNGTYIVTKRQSGGSAQTMAPSTDFASGNFAPQAISPTNNFGVPGGFNSSAFNPNNFGSNAGLVGNGALGSALPPLGQQMGNAMLNDLPTLVQANNGNNERQIRYIKIKNAPSALIAYQLDPAHNEMPVQLQTANARNNNYGQQILGQFATGSSTATAASSFDTLSSSIANSPAINPYLRTSASGLIRPEVRANSQFGGGRNQQQGGQQGGRGNQRGGAGGGNAGGSFDLPGDIEQIVSVDPQNVLLVAGGTDEDIRRLQELIDVLDQPLRQVEIEAQFVELRSQDARTFGIDFSTARGNFDAATTGFASDPVPGSFQIGFVRNNFTARLNALIANNRAKIINAPRVTAINNLTATLQSTERRSLILTTVSQNIGGQQAQGQNLLFISTTTGLTVTPTINGDDTITVLMQPQVSTQDPGNGALGTITQRQLETVANVRDGDTIALGGLKTISNSRQDYKVPLLGDIPLIGGLFRSKTIAENESELIIFLTARIIRRAGDDINVPGT